jgi:two-component system, cell cycle sensor histidine kinase and response regulator CckA
LANSSMISCSGPRILITYIRSKSGRGEEAIRLAKEHKGRIHLLLADVVMPEMSGPQALEQIQARHPHMKVLFMSGYTDEAMMHHGILESGAPFLQKPFLPETLARKVREVLASQASAG